MFNKKSKEDLLVTSTEEQNTGLSYIHCPYPIQASFLEKTLVKSMVIVVSTDQNTTCMGCVFIRLDKYLVPKIRLLLLYIQFQIIIIEIAPNMQDISYVLYNFLLRLRQLSILWSIHCIVLDHSRRSKCKHWPIFSMVICWKEHLQNFDIYKNVE